MEIEAAYDPVTEDFNIHIKVTRAYVLNSKPALINMSHMIDMEHFFGMLEDVVCMKLGLELPHET